MMKAAFFLKGLLLLGVTSTTGAGIRTGERRREARTLAALVDDASHDSALGVTQELRSFSPPYGLVPRGSVRICGSPQHQEGTLFCVMARAGMQTVLGRRGKKVLLRRTKYTYIDQ